MTTNEQAAEPTADGTVSWREMAVARSLGSARSRAEGRVDRFLDAAVEVMNESAPGKEFTVLEVVERSGQSLKTFYQYFGGKHELLLTLFEESVRSTADILRAKVLEEDDEGERLHRFVIEYCRICRPIPSAKPAKATKPAAKAKTTKAAAAAAAPKPSTQTMPMPVMVDFAQQLLTAHPAEAARAFAPVVDLFGEVLDDAAAAGVARPGLRHGAAVGFVLEAIMFNLFSSTIGGAPVKKGAVDPAEELWELIFRGIGAEA